MSTFAYTTGNPSNLFANNTANMNDIQGPFTDLSTFLNGANLDATNISPGGVTKACLASDALNAFLKLITGADRKMNMGTSTLTFSGSSVSSQTAIAHGLGVVPIYFNAMVEAGSDNANDCVVVNYTQTPDTTNIYLSGQSASGVSLGPGTNTLRWIAIG